MKKFLQYPIGSALFVVSHGQRQMSRGRNPTLSYMGEKNPRKAFELASLVLQGVKIVSVTYSESQERIRVDDNYPVLKFRGRIFTQRETLEPNSITKQSNKWNDNVQVHFGRVQDSDFTYS